MIIINHLIWSGHDMNIYPDFKNMRRVVVIFKISDPSSLESCFMQQPINCPRILIRSWESEQEFNVNYLRRNNIINQGDILKERKSFVLSLKPVVPLREGLGWWCRVSMIYKVFFFSRLNLNIPQSRLLNFSMNFASQYLFLFYQPEMAPL